MSQLADLDLGRETPPEAEPPPEGPHKPRRQGIGLLVLLLVAAGLGGFLWWHLQRDAAPPAPPEISPSPPAPAAQAPEIVPEEPEETLELPPLDESDPLLRELLTGLADHPQLARWLTPQGLARRFVTTVDNLAEGLSPRKHLPSLVPKEPFEAVERDGQLYPAPESYARYDALASFVASLDAQALADLYRSLEPLFDEAYRDLGYPDRDFRRTLDQALTRLLQTPVPSAETPLAEGIVSYHYADPKLENLSPAQRQFLRMGPQNMRRVQGKLREISTALGL